jgi:hypothetical protein
MTKLLMAIERRTRYLDRAFPKEMIRSRGAMIPIDLPGDPWADRYREMNSIPKSNPIMELCSGVLSSAGLTSTVANGGGSGVGKLCALAAVFLSGQEPPPAPAQGHVSSPHAITSFTGEVNAGGIMQ